MKMQKTCDLELRLSCSSSYDSDSDTSVVESSSSEMEKSQAITIFYNGKMCASSDVTHLQAKSIISMAASRGMKNGSDSSISSNGSTRFNQLPNPKASMKRSLQSFLQKRQLRIQATSPYHHHSRR